MAIPPPTGAPTRLAAATAAEPAVAGPACHCERSAAISSRPDFCINFPSNPRPPEAARGENAPAIQYHRARRESSPDRPEDAPIRRAIEMGSNLG